MDWMMMERWSPYLVGAGIGVLSWIAFLLSNKPIGCSTAFARTAGMIEKTFAGEKTRGKAYYRRFAPEVDWEWMLVAGVVVGAFISAMLSGTFSGDCLENLLPGRRITGQAACKSGEHGDDKRPAVMRPLCSSSLVSPAT